MAGILTYNFVLHALEAAFLASITCGFIGAYIVARRMVFISGGITHASFGGIGMGYFLGINPIFGAAIFSILSGSNPITRHAVSVYSQWSKRTQ